jgi:hypothetical protein
MKKLLYIIVLTCSIYSTLNAKDLKVLTIGNSFSICLKNYLPLIVKKNPQHSLELTSAYIGGCSLERHYINLKKAEKDINAKLYSIYIHKSSNAPKETESFKGNVNYLLQNNQYDIITIQQASHFSWKPETFEPFASEIIKYIRKYQKNAQILIQQTWSYRYDDKRLKQWNITQDQMYDKLKASYEKLAKQHNLKIIPMGDAVQIFRSKTPVKFQVSKITYTYPNVPSIAGDVVGRSYWRKSKDKKNFYLATDTFHLNNDGHYMQAALWFAFLYDEPVSKAAVAAPKNLVADKKLLLEAAALALKNNK